MLPSDGIISGDFLLLKEELVYDYMETKWGKAIHIWNMMIKNRAITSQTWLINWGAKSNTLFIFFSKVDKVNNEEYSFKFFCNHFQTTCYLLPKGFEIFCDKIHLYNETIKIEIVPQKPHREE